MSVVATLNAIRAHSTREWVAAARTADAAARLLRAAPAEQRQQAAGSRARANAMDDVLRLIGDGKAAA